MLGRITSRQFSEWMAYAQIEPFGEERADLRMGVLASLVSNMFRKAGTTAAKPEDFLLFADRDPPEPDSDNDMKSILQAVADRYKQQ